MSSSGRLPALVRSRAVLRWNRAALLLLGALLSAAGGLGLAAGLGAFGADRRSGPVLDAAVQRSASQHSWYWPAWGVGAALVALLALAWLLLQLRSESVATLRLERDRRRGDTEVRAAAVVSAVCDDARSVAGVSRAWAQLRGAPAAPRLVLVAGLDGRARPAEVARSLTGTTVAHVRQALDDDEMPARVELRTLPRGTRSVR